MSDEFKKCPYCQLVIPEKAIVCGHCGAEFEKYTTDGSMSYRFFKASIGFAQGAFSFGILAALAGFFFGESGDFISWGTRGAVAGGMIGFIGGFSESKTITTEIAKRG